MFQGTLFRSNCSKLCQKEKKRGRCENLPLKDVIRIEWLGVVGKIGRIDAAEEVVGTNSVVQRVNGEAIHRPQELHWLACVTVNGLGDVQTKVWMEEQTGASLSLWTTTEVLHAHADSLSVHPWVHI